jgi:hypothetical protein
LKTTKRLLSNPCCSRPDLSALVVRWFFGFDGRLELYSGSTDLPSDRVFVTKDLYPIGKAPIGRHNQSHPFVERGA